MKYSDVKKFYYEKYGKRIGELRFKLYLARKKQRRSLQQEDNKIIMKRRINLFVF